MTSIYRPGRDYQPPEHYHGISPLAPPDLKEQLDEYQALWAKLQDAKREMYELSERLERERRADLEGARKAALTGGKMPPEKAPKTEQALRDAERLVEALEGPVAEAGLRVQRLALDSAAEMVEPAVADLEEARAAFLERVAELGESEEMKRLQRASLRVDALRRTAASIGSPFERERFYRVSHEVSEPPGEFRAFEEWAQNVSRPKAPTAVEPNRPLSLGPIPEPMTEAEVGDVQ